MHQNVKMKHFRYDPSACDPIELPAPGDFQSLFADTTRVYWLNVTHRDTEWLEELGELMKIHELVMGNLLDPPDQPSIEDFQDYSFLSCQLVNPDGYNVSGLPMYISIGMLIFKNVIVCVHGRANDLFSQLELRLDNAKSKLRRHGCDFLLYALLDCLITHYYNVSELIGDQIDLFDTAIMKNPDHLSLGHVYQVKRDMIGIHKKISPLRHIINTITHEDYTWSNENSIIFFKDCHQYINQTIDKLDLQHDIMSNILDIYLSSVNNKTNEVMKVLAVISTIFIPLNFVAGFYGMNFVNLPGLKTHFGYLIVIGVMAMIVTGMLLFFKKIRWF